jgi:hypothetical protein
MLDVLIGTGKTPVDTVNFRHITASYGYMDAYCTWHDQIFILGRGQ